MPAQEVPKEDFVSRRLDPVAFFWGSTEERDGPSKHTSGGKHSLPSAEIWFGSGTLIMNSFHFLSYFTGFGCFYLMNVLQSQYT